MSVTNLFHRRRSPSTQILVPFPQRFTTVLCVIHVFFPVPRRTELSVRHALCAFEPCFLR
jgi:hypothetical protein